MDKEQIKNEVLSRISCTEFLEKSKHGQYCCPFCGSGKGEHQTGAGTYYPQTNTFYCHRCHSYGDPIALYRKQTGSGYIDALQALGQRIGLCLDNARTTAAPQPKPAPAASPADYTAYYQLCRQRLGDPAAVQYLQDRGISLATAQAYGLGYDPAWRHPKAPKMEASPRIIIPIGAENYLARHASKQDYINYKGEVRNKMKASIETGLPWTFNACALYAEDAQEVFVTEGELDALAIAEAGGNAVAIGSAAYDKAFVRQLEQHRPTAKVLLLCLDKDAAGNEATATIEAGAERLKIPAYDVREGIMPQEGCKDPNEVLVCNSSAFRSAVASARRWARDRMDELQEAAQYEEQARQQRTGAAMIDAFIEEIRTQKYEPIPTGISDLDRALGGGFMRQWLVLLGAPPGAGKTALAQWIFEGMAERGTTCVYVNLEMSRAQLLARSISRIAAKNGDNVKPIEVLQGYKWNIEQEDAILTAAEEYKRDIAPRMIYNPDGITSDLDGIMQYLEDEAARAEAARLPAPFVVLDYLQVVTGRPREDKTDLIQRAIGKLKDFAIEHNTLVFCIMAQNREANRTGISSMESGRDTSNIEYGADLLLGLDFTKCYPDANGNKADPRDLTEADMRLKTLKINKGRFIEPRARVDLYFDGATMTFTLSEKEHEAPQQRAATKKRY